MVPKLDQKVAIVTGASSGIGEATAIALATEGARVVVIARREDRLSDLVKKIEGQGGKALAITGDMTDEKAIKQIMSQVKDQMGQLDILVNNAGVMLLSPIAEAQTEDWRQMVEVNLIGLMFASHAALPIMQAQGGGHIVNVSSTAGRQVNPGSAVYSATKFGVGAFSEGLRREVYKDKIRVTIIEPGAVDTELTDHITNATTQQNINQWKSSMRQLKSEDIAAAIVYAVTQPDHVNVNEILIRPTDQER